MFRICLTLLAIAALLTGCSSGPASGVNVHAGPHYTLPDNSAYSQKDRRWANDRMGGSGASIKAEGCLVAATSMALTNLGFKINPGQLNARLKKQKGYTSSGLLIWSSIEKVSKGRAVARYHDKVNEGVINSCMRDGFYPLARFILPNGRTHWAMIVRKSARGYHMRDPLHPSNKPLIFGQGISGFQAIRCIGRKT